MPRLPHASMLHGTWIGTFDRMGAFLRRFVRDRHGASAPD